MKHVLCSAAVMIALAVPASAITAPENQEGGCETDLVKKKPWVVTMSKPVRPDLNGDSPPFIPEIPGVKLAADFKIEAETTTSPSGTSNTVRASVTFKI